MVAILPELNRASGLTILLIEHVMRAVMALAHARAGAASRRGHRAGRAGRGRARPAGDQILPRRRGTVMLTVESLDLFYGDAQALDAVYLSVPEGAIVAIVGANGAGKTSLIRAIAGMQRPARGRIRFRGTDITGWPSYRICNLGIGQVAEGRQLFPTPDRRREPGDGRHAAARPRAARAQSRARARAVSASSPNARARRPARCRAASSRCWRSAAA